MLEFGAVAQHNSSSDRQDGNHDDSSSTSLRGFLVVASGATRDRDAGDHRGSARARVARPVG
jgi:hypothetical protein